MSSRTYRDAISRLNSLQSNQATIEASRASGGRIAQFGMHDTEEYLSRIGYSPQDLDGLNVLHVAGTKGKGSTCAFINSILQHSQPQWKIGLYTSPHLVAVRERIRINGKPISEEDFAKYFFEVWDRLEKNDKRKYDHTLRMPMYFRMVTLVAFHAFMDLKVDATILEVGVGGLYDCTNIVPKPVVTGVSALGIDHVAILGGTLREIAFQKGGIYKEGVPAFSVEQPEEGLEVLGRQARDRKASSFTVCSMLPGLSSIKLGLSGAHQCQNANLSLYLSHEFLIQKGAVSPTTVTLSSTYIEALEKARWPGRCQEVADSLRKNVTWFLDGAHTIDSLEYCLRWFFSPGAAWKIDFSKRLRIMVFTVTHGRNGNQFLSAILSEAKAQLRALEQPDATIFDHVVFCSNVTYADGSFKGDLASRIIAEDIVGSLEVQRMLASAWGSLLPDYPKENIHVLPSIGHMLQYVQKLSTASVSDAEMNNGGGKIPVDILVTGSLHLVGGVVEVAGLSEVAL